MFVLGRLLQAEKGLVFELNLFELLRGEFFIGTWTERYRTEIKPVYMLTDVLITKQLSHFDWIVILERVIILFMLIFKLIGDGTYS